MVRKGKNKKPHTASNAQKTDSNPTAGSLSPADAPEGTTKRVPNWARFVIGAFVTAVVGLLVADLYPGVKSKIIHTPPIIFKTNQVVGPGWGVTIPDQPRLQPLLNSIHDCDSLHAAAVAAGGADDYGANLNLVVQGNASSGVTITGMHVRIIKRSAPLNGAYAFCQSAGSEEAMPINFNLNDQVPAAMGAPAGSPGQGSKPSFFANGSVVHLDDGEVFPFRVAATVSGSAVEWVIEASVLINGQPSTVTINDNGRPFETTAALPLTQYGDLYEYDWAAQQRLLHFRSHARTSNDCAADVAMKALQSQGLSGPSQVLTVDCASDLTHVEVWVPSERCYVHYLGFHEQSHWRFFASRTVCPSSDNQVLGALFSRATISHAKGNAQAFANAFGSYIVSSASIPANPGPYDHVPTLSASNLAARAGCTSMQSFASYSASVGANQTATCETQGAPLLILTFPDSVSRNGFFNRKLNSTNSLESRGVGTRQLLVVGPTWLVYGTEVYQGEETYVACPHRAAVRTGSRRRRVPIRRRQCADRE